MSAYSDLILATTGLVGYWRLGESSGDAAPAFGSITGTNTDITYAATGALTGDADTAYTYNGSTSKTLLGNSAPLQLSTGSVEAWFKTSTISGAGAIIVKANAYGLFIFNSHLAFHDWGGGGGWREDDVDVIDSAWHHVVYVFESGASNGSFIYLDGALTYTSTMTIADQTVEVGVGRQADFANLFTGQIDEVAIYNTKLDAGTIAAHYELGVNGPSSRYARIRNQFQLRPY